MLSVALKQLGTRTRTDGLEVSVEPPVAFHPHQDICPTLSNVVAFGKMTNAGGPDTSESKPEISTHMLRKPNRTEMARGMQLRCGDLS